MNQKLTFISFQALSSPGSTLLIDVSGHTHYEEWVELGYTLKGKTLDNGNYDYSQVSISSLYNTTTHNLTIQEMLSGNNSLGALLEMEGYKTVPSPEFPSPDGRRYLRGGYTVQKYNNNVTATLSIAVPQSLRVKKQGEGPQFIHHLGNALLHFLSIHYPPCGEACHVTNQLPFPTDDTAEYITHYYRSSTEKLIAGSWLTSLIITFLTMYNILN